MPGDEFAEHDGAGLATHERQATPSLERGENTCTDGCEIGGHRSEALFASAGASGSY